MTARWYVTPAVAPTTTWPPPPVTCQRAAIVAPVYTAMPTSAPLPVVSNANCPLTGAVQRYHTELGRTDMPQPGSPGSSVAQALLPVVVPDSPPITAAEWRLSFAGIGRFQWRTTCENWAVDPALASTAIMYVTPAAAEKRSLLVPNSDAAPLS